MRNSAKKETVIASATKQTIARELLELLCLALVLWGLGYFFLKGGNFHRSEPPAQFVDTNAAEGARAALCGTPSPDGRAVVVEMAYSDEKGAWVEFAADRFSRLCPNIQVRLTALPDIEAVSLILKGELRPTLWAPTDEISLRYFEQRFREQEHRAPFQDKDKTELLSSPLVLLIWQDRLRVLSTILREERSEEGSWVRGQCARIPRDPVMDRLPVEQMVPGSWGDWYAPLLNLSGLPNSLAMSKLPSRAERRAVAVRPIGDVPMPPLAEIQSWGRVKIEHARPTRDSAGAAALYLMAYDYLLPPSERDAVAAAMPETSGQARALQESLAQRLETNFAERKPSLRKWLQRCEAGLESSSRTVSGLTTSLLDLGPSRYDGVVTYEHLALPFLERADQHSGALQKLVIVYPKPLLVARHPAVLLDGDAAQKDAAERWLRFLQSREMQEKGIDWGFRPINPAVHLQAYSSPQNRFLRLRRYGVLLQPHLIEAPRANGHLLNEIIALWGEVTGRN